MFTSRAEFRTLLRQDNADLRLTELSYRLGLASQEIMNKVIKKREGVKEIRDILREHMVEPTEVNAYLTFIDSAVIFEKQRAEKILLRPDIELKDLAANLPRLQTILDSYSPDVIEQASIQIKYDVYIEKEKELVKKMNQLEELEIPENFDFKRINALGNEAREKLTKIKPRTLGQASRISGINPSDVQILMVYMGR
jgi:tRNA uridine 5-carboxymethylaminomethyl modification enzyme